MGELASMQAVTRGNAGPQAALQALTEGVANGGKRVRKSG